jgi:hypothetical protein
MDLYKGGLIYGWAYTWTIFCVSNKQVLVINKSDINKSVINREINVYFEGLIFEWAYIRGGGGLYLE